uniref:Uncharacterized protein n=1 Tax=Chenopodium quinoa TaxID=63459 RepID=A0A803KWH5_CHEQI
MATSVAGARLSSTPLTLFGTASARRRSAAFVAVNAESKEDNYMNGKAVISGGMEEEQEVKRSWRDYFELAKLFIGSDGAGCRGPPRWFSPLETGKRMHSSPLLLYLPGFLMYGACTYLSRIELHFKVLADILPRDTLLWKLQMMKSACSFANSRLHAVKAQILILASGRDPLLPSLEEAERIRGALPKQEIRVSNNTGKMPKCEIRNFRDSGHFLFLEEGVDLVTIIKGTSLYRRGKSHDYF